MVVGVEEVGSAPVGGATEPIDPPGRCILDGVGGEYPIHGVVVITVSKEARRAGPLSQRAGETSG
jgi:hypothetical protein